MIEVINISKNYGETSVLSHVSATIKEGSIFGLIGINGAGKSTLLRLMSGIIKPDTGDILIDGLSPFQHEHIRQKVFYLSDQPNYAPSMSLKHLADLYTHFYPFDMAIFKHVLDVFGLDMHTQFGKLSKGTKRQGMIAIAFASAAKYLLLDEVFDGLDPAARLKFKKIMLEHQQTEKTFILTSHSLRELEDICDAFGMIDQGCFKHYGDLNEELHKIKKYQIILSSTESVVFKSNHPSYTYKHQEGRVLTLICEQKLDVEAFLNSDQYIVSEVSPITFEEYFLVQQEVSL